MAYMGESEVSPSYGYELRIEVPTIEFFSFLRQRKSENLSWSFRTQYAIHAVIPYHDIRAPNQWKIPLHRSS
jgi:hypothetical protein